MKIPKLSPFLGILLFIVNTALSQEIDIDFGEVDKRDLEMIVYEPDSSASAVVLYDYGHSYFRFNKQEYSLNLNFDTHIRIKILKKDALSRGTFTIPLYNIGNRSKEEIVNSKGYTFNLVDGKVQRSKLKGKNKFIEVVDDRHKKVTFTFPDVKVGSVIDFKYTKTSDFNYTLESWFFQSDIPVVWSEYIVEIPEYYNYYKNTKGYEAPYLHEENIKNRRHYITNKSRSGGTRVTKTSYSNNELSYDEKIYRFVYKDVPAFKNESFIGSAKDYISQVGFELQSVQFPNSTMKSYSNNYKSISKKLLDEKRFGQQLNSAYFLRKEVELIESQYSEPEQKMQAAFDWVKNNIKWNENTGLYAKTSIKDIYKEKEGNAGGINLLLTTLLRALNLNANPVALSTRSNGRLPITHPSLTNFNYVIAHVNINNEEYILDATSTNLPINQLPARCLNDKGRLIKEGGGKWVTLNNNTVYNRSEMIKVSVNTDGELVGKRRIINNNYAAYSKRASIEEEGGIDKYFESFADNDADYYYEGYIVENLDSINSPLIEKMEISTQFSDGEDIIYFNPLLNSKMEENPFVQEERNYPVDFPYPTKQKYMIQIEIPEGYEVQELPKKINASLPENAGNFRYQTSLNGKNLMVITQINLNKQLFIPAEYQSLKQFYKIIIDKHSEMVVLKKSEGWSEQN